ncbi:Uma2 family endonuclease [Methylocystis sp. JAN1]|uniref:Uma2 family endonuclease n=1 Tax=Methylocystis sp. JAN1 TaxID=3397211 RepID=UPI003FA2777E
MPEPAVKRMNAPEFLYWAESQESGRYELVRGETIAMAPERAEHGRVKARVWRALSDAIDRTASPCEAFVDSLGVAIDEFTVYQPDALVNCGAAIPPDALLAPAPTVIVEVISPSSRRLDTNAKLADYFRVASVRHYLVIDCIRRLVIHYSRQDDRIAVAFVKEGTIVLDQPALSIQVADIFP